MIITERIRTAQQQFPPSVGPSQSFCSCSRVKQARDDQLSGSVPPSLPPFLLPSLLPSLPPPGRLRCHPTQTFTCLPPDRRRGNTTLRLVLPDFCRRYTARAHHRSPALPPALCSPFLGRRPATTGGVRDLRQRHLSPSTAATTPPPALLIFFFFIPYSLHS